MTSAKGCCALLPGKALLVDPSRACKTPPPLIPRLTSLTLLPLVPAPVLIALSIAPMKPFCHVIESPKKSIVIPSWSGLAWPERLASPGTS
jgi:hypothetical protein